MFKINTMDTFDLMNIIKAGEAAKNLLKIIELKNAGDIESVDKEIQNLPAELSSAVADIKREILYSTLVYISKCTNLIDKSKEDENDTLQKAWFDFLAVFDKRERTYSFVEYNYKLTFMSLLIILDAKDYREQVVKHAIDDFIDRLASAVKSSLLETSTHPNQYSLGEIPYWNKPIGNSIHDMFAKNYR